jgi:hypothetical protein
MQICTRTLNLLCIFLSCNLNIHFSRVCCVLCDLDASHIGFPSLDSRQDDDSFACDNVYSSNSVSGDRKNRRLLLQIRSKEGNNCDNGESDSFYATITNIV